MTLERGPQEVESYEDVAMMLINRLLAENYFWQTSGVHARPQSEQGEQPVTESDQMAAVRAKNTALEEENRKLREQMEGLIRQLTHVTHRCDDLQMEKRKLKQELTEENRNLRQQLVGTVSANAHMGVDQSEKMRSND